MASIRKLGTMWGVNLVAWAFFHVAEEVKEQYLVI